MRSIDELKEIAQKVRIESIKAIYQAGSGHPGSSLSSAEILTVLYFGGILKHDQKNPFSNERDYFILSNGHACPAWYSALALSGYFDLSELSHLREIGHFLQGHPDKSKFNLVETTTGSLGQGITVGLGLALGLKRLNKDNLVYVLESDGEQDEGAVWEVNRIASHYKLNNLKIIIDRNGMQIDFPTEKDSALEPLDKKYESFGFQTKTIEGHDTEQVIKGLNWLKEIKTGPGVLIAKTTRGKGVSFMENSLLYHARSLSRKEYEDALSEL